MSGSLDSSKAIRRTLMVTSAVPIGALLLLAALLMWQVLEVRENTDWNRQSVEIERATSNLGAAVLVLEASGDALRSRPTAPQPTLAPDARAKVAECLATLADGVHSSPERLARVQAIGNREQAWERGLLTLQGLLQGPTPTAQLATLMASNDVAAVQMRHEITQFRRAEIDLLERRQIALMHSANLCATLGGIGLSAALLFFVLIGRRQLRAVGEHAQELEQANTRLREVDRLKDEFLGNVSHELRTPLNAVIGFGSVLEDGVLGKLEGQQALYLSKMLDGAYTLLGLIDDLLDMGRFEAGRYELDYALLEPGECAEEVIARLQPLAAKKDIRITFEGRGQRKVSGERRRIVQIFTNLIGNAIKFTPAHGRIEVRVNLQEDTYLCEVRDTGPGVRPEDEEKLFKRFGQVQSGNVRSTGGTGLGLSISKAIVSAHGGQIGFRAAQGGGAIFWFSLPAQGATAATDAAASATRPE